MDDCYTPLIIAFLVIMFVLIICLILYSTSPSSEKFGDTITRIMDDVPDVPTIRLVEKSPKKNIFQKMV